MTWVVLRGKLHRKPKVRPARAMEQKTKTQNTRQKPNMLNCANGALNVDMFYLITYLEFHYIYILLAAFHSLKLLF